MNMNDIELQKMFFRPVCNKDEIERIFNVLNAEDYLLKLRAETIVDHTRLFRVYRNKALLNKNNWSLEKSFDQSHFITFTQNLDSSDRKKCERITAGNIFSNDPTGIIFPSDYGPIITISDSLRFFFKFMNLALMDFGDRVPGYVHLNSLRIAIRVMLQTESLDFLMDPRGIVPKDIGEAIHSTIPNQMLFIGGHEYAHYLLGHISESNVSEKYIFNAILPTDENYKLIPVYNPSQKQELEADEKSILLPNYNNEQRKRLLESALLYFGSIELFKAVKDTIDPPKYNPPHPLLTHPSPRDRYENILSMAQQTSHNLNINRWKRFWGVIDSYKKFLIEDASYNTEEYEMYGSAYLDKPNSEWRGPELRDRINYY